MKRNHSAGLFLMEIIVVILFFSVCAGICIQAFAKADSMSREASSLNHAVVRAESAAEEIRAAAGTGNAEDYRRFWDTGWRETQDEKAAAYRMEVTLTDDGAGMEQAEISVLKQDGTELYALSVRHYLGQAEEDCSCPVFDQ